MNETSLDELPLALIRQVDAIARRAEKTLRSGQAFQIEQCLSEVPPEAEAALLEELLSLENEYRAQQGETLSQEELLERFPNHLEIIQRVLKDGGPSEGQHAGSAPDGQLLSQRFPNIPGYTIEKQLGRGAMGVVYLARQERLQRLVAVKMVAAGFDLPQAAAIVRAEAEVIARLKHPNIVQVYEIGEDNGEPFLTIEYVDGESLREKLMKERLPQRQSVELIESLARAIHHAHTNGVVHRDLKPANILLLKSSTENPKISDFGLAKVLDVMHEQTRTGVVLGTPKYMAPEQAEGRSNDIGPGTDVYALGAILFELLTGKAPFESASSLKLLQLISEHEAKFPADANQNVTADLQAVCLKCLEKKSDRRYASALELADDVRRYLDDFPVIARRPTKFDQLKKFIRRNRAVTASIATVFATLIAASIGIGIFAIRESQARKRAEELAKQEGEARSKVESLREEERRNVYWANLHLAQKAWQGNRLTHMRDHLQQSVPATKQDEDLRGFEWHYLWRLSHPQSLVLDNHHGESKVTFSPDGRFMASPNKRGEVRIFDASTGEVEFELPGHHRVMDIAFSPDGNKLAVGDRNCKVILWDLQSREILRIIEDHKSEVRSVAFSPDGALLVTADEVDRIIAWQVSDGHQLWSVKRPELYVTDIDFSPSGDRLVFGRGQGQIVIIDSTDGRELQTIDAHSRWLTGVAFSPNGEQVASCSGDRTAKVWTLRQPEEPLVIVGHEDWLTAVTYSHDGKSLGTSSHDGTVRLWNAATGRNLVNLAGHSNWVRSVAFSPDDQLVASAAIDGTARIWRPSLDWEVRTLATQDAPVSAITFSPQGDRMFMGCNNGDLAIHDVKSGEQLHFFKAHNSQVRQIAFAPGGKQMATAGDDKVIKFFDPDTAQELFELRGHTGDVCAILFLPNSHQFVSASHDQTIRVWDTVARKEVRQIQRNAAQLTIACSPDGRLLASSGTPNVELWDTTTWNKVAELKGQTHVLAWLSFSSDGRLLATGGTDRTIAIWDVIDGRQLKQFTGHTNVVSCVAFSQDGRRLISCGQDGSVRIWETQSGRELLTLQNHSDWVNSVTFNPTESAIASASQDHTVKLIELE